jgi:transcriptional regulator with XRE-family HTH domain
LSNVDFDTRPHGELNPTEPRPYSTHKQPTLTSRVHSPQAPETPHLELTPDLRHVLAERDVTGLYRALQEAGISQRRIASLTGQAQSEISEILGGRRVHSISVLERICDGLGIERSTMGLAQPAVSTEPVGVTALATGRPHRATGSRGKPAAPRGRLRHVTGPEGTPDVALWTGDEIWTLRQAMRMTPQDFADYLGVGHRTLVNWESGTMPDPFHQTLFDTALERAPQVVRSRFMRLMTNGPHERPSPRRSSRVPTDLAGQPPTA